jgi:hypothetical protein
VERAHQVHRHHAFEVFGRHRLDTVGNRDASGIDKNVDTAEAGEGAIDGVADFAAAGDVCGEHEGFAAGVRDIKGQGLEHLGAAGEEGDFRAHFDEGQGEVAADTARSAGDEDDSFMEIAAVV